MNTQELFGEHELKRLTPEEETACFRIFQTDPRPAIKRAAIMKIITGHIPFVITCASKYKPKNMEMEELVDEGIIGMIKAAKTYKINKQCSFLSYAVWWIMQTIQDAIYSKSHTVYIPTNQLTLANKVAKRMRCGETFDTAVSVVGGNKQAILAAMRAMDITSLDLPVEQDEVSTSKIMDLIPAEDLAAIKKKYREKETIYSLINKLPKDQKDIINRYYGLDGSDLNMRDIGTVMGRSHQRIQSIKKQVLRKLKPKMIQYEFGSVLS